MPRVELVDPKHFKILIHGETGVGKTRLAGSSALVPDLCPILFFDLEDGRLSIRNVPDIDLSRIVFWSVEGQRDLRDLEKAVTTETDSYRTVVVDSLTEMYALMMNIHLKEQNRVDNPPQIQDYGFVTYRLLRFLRMIKEEGKVNFIATAGTALTKDELDGSIHYEPDITGKMNYRVARYFDVVGALSVSFSRPRGGQSTVTRSLQVQPYKRVRAKDRSGGLGISVGSPTMMKIYSAFRRGKEKPANG